MNTGIKPGIIKIQTQEKVEGNKRKEERTQKW